eukprot:TRINITY_DN7477_c0_g1_i1.p1 TRINITY_DN7477_c0_g1~~TRINITY_DN7477_c0_g1_i1.p1  ORF type:complete len:333 (-),score=44.12 TRINITY_DN7477_c0_g1_i1:282-1280(-)
MIRPFKVKDFITVCSQLSYFSGQIINEVYESKDLGEKLKGKDDPYTIADLKVQKMIVQGIRHYWPTVQLVGEESEDYPGPIDLDSDALLDEKFLELEAVLDQENVTKYHDTFNVEDLTIFIDPLDGTLDFVRGGLDCVTTLIGVANKGKPLIGLVAKHYVMNELNKPKFQPRIYFGYVGVKEVLTLDTNEDGKIPRMIGKLPNMANTSKIDNFSVVTSLNHFSEKLGQILKTVPPTDTKRVGGAGNKFVHILENKADCYIYEGKGMKRWDTLPIETLIRCAGGYISDVLGADYEYSFRADNDYMNYQGILCTKSKELYIDMLTKVAPFFSAL